MTGSLRNQASAIDGDAIDDLARHLENADPFETLAWAFEEFGEDVAIATGFGVEGVVLVDMATRLHPSPFVFFVDTGFLFEETYALRERLERRYGIEIRAVDPELSPQQQEDVFGARLWHYDPDFCCSLRKVEPLATFLAGRGAWVTAIRRSQTAARASARVVEWDAKFDLVKINPLVTWSRERVWEYVFDRAIPYNPLHDRGYPSIGCTHCTRAIRPGESERAGRWANHAKTECGLHLREEKS